MPLKPIVPYRLRIRDKRAWPLHFRARHLAKTCLTHRRPERAMVAAASPARQLTRLMAEGEPDILDS